ncbi:MULTISPECIES: restriction endonuclease [Clostridium]|uniref:Restriction endonuclease n=2 Tax=Clostridium TaxID=1485 RepID=A0A151ANT4_9CLOT|nr:MULTISPECIES: restriction endonuclease [Clostridium]KYH29220.1 restriction endonuclease [Clostridium colicanis DSM 13634]MBE6042916.1 restriction endonuclease [Clostridium thermopalmarium]PRR71065.1 Restriction endonuclease [Clostridium thermopalmarium DSM 5974]PVZ23596.1 restriction endonuclease [Clostridium thermopalmarium DSM 5974]
MNPLKKLILCVFILILLNILNKLLYPIEDKIKKRFKQETAIYGLISRYFLSHLSESEFEEYCSYLLNNMGYFNIVPISEDFIGGLSLICNKSSNSKIYVSCIKSPYKENNTDDKYAIVGRPELQKFIGIMVHDKVKKGIVITTGDFSDHAIEYVNHLSSEYDIKLINGIELSKISWEIRQKNIKNHSIANLLS